MKRYLTGSTLLLLLAFTGLGLAAVAPPVKPQLREPATASQVKGKVDPVTGMEFVFVKGGCYRMGSNDGVDDEKPVHEVCVSDFYLGKYEVTQRQWERVMGNNPSNFKKCGRDCPVESISWNDAQEFIGKLNSLSGRQYRLPTEAEWEYAARSGGRDEKYAGTSDDGSLGKYGWYDKNSFSVTHRVGLKKANGLGLHDMSGNVYEWCQDWYNETYYEGSPRENSPGALIGESRVLRGGSWIDVGYNARAAGRFSADPGSGIGDNGLRLVIPAK